jgi:non-specific serine/threonine protein kinase
MRGQDKGERMFSDAPTFAEVLRRHRQARGLTQEDLAERATLSARAISDLERGLKETPHATTVHLLVRALELDEDTADAFAAAARRRVVTSSPARQRDNLPVALTSFVGRQHACAEVKQTLATARLVTLVGGGGVGKTRLALAVAESVADGYADGVWLVELASLADPDLVPQTVATALGIREQPGRPLITTLLDGLRARGLLLVVDNCEHLGQACADLVQALLRTCPSLRVLATSRERLGIAGEVVWRVLPLEFPTTGQDRFALAEAPEAVRLFVERARAALPEILLAADNTAAIAEICRRLDGLPLAIELAAPLVRVLTPVEIAARLDDSFGLLGDGGRSVPRHQRSLRAAITWGYSGLADPEQRLFDELSVFAGGWTLESAAAVSSSFSFGSVGLVHVMARLVDTSLIVSDVRTAARYRMFESLREFGRDQLSEHGNPALTAARHATYFAALADRAATELSGAAQAGWLIQLEAEHDNLRGALTWAANNDAELLLRLATDLGFFWILRGHWSEGRRWLDSSLVMGDNAKGVSTGRALFAAGTLAWLLGDLGTARQRAETCLVAAREQHDVGLESRALALLGNLAHLRGDLAAARALVEHSLACARAVDDRWAEGRALDVLAICALKDGDLDAAERYLEHSASVSRAANDSWSLGMSVNALGDLARVRGQTSRARAFYEEALEKARVLGATGPSAVVRSNLGHLAHQDGDDLKAAGLFAEGLPLVQMFGRDGDVIGCLVGVAGVSFGSGHAERAAQLFGAVEAGLDRSAESLWPSNRVAYERDVQRTRHALGETRFHEAWEVGRAMSLDEAVRSALDLLTEVVNSSATPSTMGTRTHLPAGTALTVREREIVGLIRRGLSNRQIAAELVIAEKTAINHVAHVLDKLGVHSRAQLVARASELGLESLPS